MPPSAAVLEGSGISFLLLYFFILWKRGYLPPPPISSKSHVFRKPGKPKIQGAKEN